MLKRVGAGFSVVITISVFPRGLHLYSGLVVIRVSEQTPANASSLACCFLVCEYEVSRDNNNAVTDAAVPILHSLVTVVSGRAANQRQLAVQVRPDRQTNKHLV